MRTSLHDVWGCARGPVARLAPQTRVLSGAGVFAACMVAPGGSLVGALFVLTATTSWLVACQLPARVVRSTTVLGLALFLPYFLLIPIMPREPAALAATEHGLSVAVPLGILVHGLSGMLISIATVATLSASDLREALVRLPIPRVGAAILLQIVHQTATLFYETRRVAAAMAVRGATGSLGTAWRVLVSLPQVWLPRVIGRAERVAAAMELRGFCDGEPHTFSEVETGVVDLVAVGLCLLAIGGAVAVRVWGAT